MNREELAALRDAIDTLLEMPDNVRAEVARWLALPASKPNGHDPHPPPIASTVNAKKLGDFPPRRSPTPYAGKARAGSPSTSAKADRKLIEAMGSSPGLTVAALATTVAAGRSATGARLRQLAARGVVEKSATGRWKLREEPRSAPSNGAEPDPPQPSP